MQHLPSVRRPSRSAVVAALLISTSAAAQPAPADDPAAPMDVPATSDPAPAHTIAGRVVDGAGNPVAGAHVTHDGTSVTTGDDGRFRITAPAGATLIVDATGFDVALVSVTADVLGDIAMPAAGSTAERIEIHSEAPAASPGAAKIDRSELQRLPGAGGDVVRAVGAMPGVVNLQIPLGYSGFAIRGSSPQDSKVMVDGFEIPLLFHNIAFRAVLPAEAIESIDYIPGGFDVAHGRATSGIVALTTRPGSETRSTQGELSLIDGGLLAQGAAGKHTRYMIGLRRSMIDLVLPSVIPDDADLSLTTVPRYYDAQLRVDHELSARWRLMFAALGADDKLALVESRDANAEAKRFSVHTQFARVTAAAQYHEGPWSATLALSGMYPRYDADMGLYQHVRYSFPAVTPRGELTWSARSLGGLTDVVWRSGAESQVSRVAVDLAIPRETREGEPEPNDDLRDTSTMYDGVIWLPNAAAWTSLAANVAPRVRLSAGVRADYFGHGEEVVVQPRGELQIKLPHALTARLSAGLFSRPPEYQSEVLTERLDSERSAQMIAGLTYEPDAGTRVQASAYYTDRSRLIMRAADGDLANDGSGTTVGAELLGSYRDGPWFGWLSYAYSHSTRVDRPGMERRLFDFDQPHSLNAAVSWRRGRWQLGGRFQLYSGLPFTPATGSVLDSDRNVYMPVFGPVNSERAPIHHQLDVRIDYGWRWGAAAMTAFLDVQNVYMNESVVTYFYSYDYSQRSAFKSLPLLPSIGLRGVL